MATVGITGYGAYLPRLRLQREAVAAANGWFDPGLKALGKGERTMCNWDEDAITMAVEAAADCLGPLPRRTPGLLVLASTSMPFADRQNSVVVAEALNLETEGLRTMDVSGSQRASTTGLLSAIDAAAAGSSGAVVVASERRRTLCGSREEMLYGDGAAAIAVGSHDLLAEVVAQHSAAVDFVDHHRGAQNSFDYPWEERWVRDEGLSRIIPAAVSGVLRKAGVDASRIRHFIVPTDQDRVPGALARELGIPVDAVADNLAGRVGVTGTAHALLLLAHRLETARCGEYVLLVGFGQGCDALLLRTTGAVERWRPERGANGNLARGRRESNYNKFQSFNDLVLKDLGKRAEVDRQAYLAALYRDRAFVTGFKGGRCRSCGTVQLPRHHYCVNPDCGARDTQDEYPMSGRAGRVTTWTADRLTFDLDPPAYYGMIAFEGGGRLMMDIGEVDPEAFDTGAEVGVHFRVRQFGDQRGFRKYFWKAIPR
ncbi:MAG: OB-fold domain-containing protein [Burkholderiales bacterium]|nr:OB-fold domain-containing protein [Burkholderiales bacterium]